MSTLSISPAATISALLAELIPGGEPAGGSADAAASDGFGGADDDGLAIVPESSCPAQGLGDAGSPTLQDLTVQLTAAPAALLYRPTSEFRVALAPCDEANAGQYSAQAQGEPSPQDADSFSHDGDSDEAPADTPRAGAQGLWTPSVLYGKDRVRDGTRFWYALEFQWSLRLVIGHTPPALDTPSSSFHGAHFHVA